MKAQRVLVIFHPFQSGLRIGVTDLAIHAGAIVAQASDLLWILPLRTRDWFIEVSMLDREVRWTKALPVC
jgi:hypothetical protein